MDDETQGSFDHQREPRMAISLCVSWEEAEGTRHEYATDISPGGLFIQTPRPCEVGRRLDVRLQVPCEDDRIVSAAPGVEPPPAQGDHPDANLQEAERFFQRGEDEYARGSILGVGRKREAGDGDDERQRGSHARANAGAPPLYLDDPCELHDPCERRPSTPNERPPLRGRLGRGERRDFGGEGAWLLLTVGAEGLPALNSS